MYVTDLPYETNSDYFCNLGPFPSDGNVLVEESKVDKEIRKTLDRALKMKQGRALKIHQEIELLQKSDHFLPPGLLQEWAKRLIIANNIHIQISTLKNDPAYLAHEDLDKLARNITALENVQQNPVQDEVRNSDLECWVCLKVPKLLSQVFSCRQNHILCQSCKNKPFMWICQVCGQDFIKNPPTRNRLAEKCISLINKND